MVAGFSCRKSFADLLPSVLVAGIAFVRDSHKLPVPRIEQADVRLGSANIARKNHIGLSRPGLRKALRIRTARGSKGTPLQGPTGAPPKRSNHPPL